MPALVSNPSINETDMGIFISFMGRNDPFMGRNVAFMGRNAAFLPKLNEEKGNNENQNRVYRQEIIR